MTFFIPSLTFYLKLTTIWYVVYQIFSQPFSKTKIVISRLSDCRYFQFAGNIVDYKCNNTLLLVYLNIVCLHAQTLYHFKEHLRRITYIFIVRIYKITEVIAQFNFRVLKNIRNYNILTLLYSSYLLVLGFNY